MGSKKPGKAGLWFFIIMLILGTLACTLSSEAPTPLPTLVAPAGTTSALDTGQSTGASGATQVGNLMHYEDADLGVAFDYPAGWSQQKFPTFVAVASNAALLAENAPYIEGGALVLVAAGPDQAAIGTPLAAALDEVVAELEGATDAQVVEGPIETTINGQDAVVAVLSDIDQDSGENIFFHVTYLRDRGYGVVVAGTALQVDEAQFRPVFEAIAGSVILSPPQLPPVIQPVPIPAGEITLGQTVSGEILKDSAVSWAYTGSAGEAVTIFAEPTTSGLDLIVDVLNSEGNTILPAGAIDDSFTTETITDLALPADGTYQIVLAGFLGSGGEYKLTLNPTSSEFNFLTPGTIITGSLAGGDADQYAMAATAGMSFTFVIAPDPELDVVLEVFDRADNSLLLSQDEGFSGEGELAVFTPQRSGEFLVKISEFSNTSNGDYIMNVATAASALLVDSGDLAAGETVDFTLPFPAGETIVVAAVPDDTLDMVVSFLDAAGAQLANTDVGFENAPEVFAYTIPTDGDYTIRLNGFDDTAGTYRLIVSSEGSTASPEPAEGNVSAVLTPGLVQVDTLPAAGENVYRFTGRNGETSTFFVLPEDELDVVVEITDAGGQPVLLVDQGFTGEGEVIKFTPDASGEYQLLVRSFVAIGGGYVMGMLDEEAALLNETGTVGNNTAVEYEVSIPAGATRIIMVFPENAFDAQVEIVDSNQQVVAESDIGIAGEPEILHITAQNDDQVTIRISGFVNIGGSYSIVVIDLPAN